MCGAVRDSFDRGRWRNAAIAKQRATDNICRLAAVTSDNKLLLDGPHQDLLVVVVEVIDRASREVVDWELHRVNHALSVGNLEEWSVRGSGEGWLGDHTLVRVLAWRAAFESVETRL